MTISFNVKLTTVGQPLECVIETRRASLDSAHLFALRTVQAFSDVIGDVAPRDTGSMADLVAQIVPFGSTGNDLGFGAGPYSQIGDPAKKAPKGTIEKFVIAYPRLRGKRPLAPKGAWWTLSKAGKAKLQETRRQSNAKPAYWYAIARGLVPDAEGNNLPANIFVDFAIDFANSERKALAKAYFGG